MSQTAVNEQGLALVGQKYSLVKDQVLSYAAEGRVPFGRLVCLGTDKDKQVKLPALSGDVTGLKAKRGVALQQHSLENAQDGLAPGYPDKHPVSVMSKGAVYVEVEEAVDAGDDVYVRYAGKQQVQTVVFSADLVASNTINGEVGGIAIAEVTFDTNHLTTMNAIAAAILAANPYIESAVVGGASNRTITLTTVQDADDQDAADFVVAAGASQATVTETETVAAVHSDKKGIFRTDADSSSAAALAGARWLKSSETVDGKLVAVLELGVA
jgi:hypothetical protein